MSLLEIKHLRAAYHDIEVLHGLNLSMDNGDFVAVIGSNGAGKTTFLRAISRLVSARGSILFQGNEILTLNPRDVIKGGIIHCPEGRLLFPNMTVYNNLLMGAFLRRDRNSISNDLDRVFAYLPVLWDRKNQLAGTLSGGEQQMLAVGRAIMGQPVLLTLDEPSFGLAPMVIESIFEVVQKLNDEGVAILLVEQNAALALDLSSYAYVLEQGQIINQGESVVLTEDPSVTEAYLGMN